MWKGLGIKLYRYENVPDTPPPPSEEGRSSRMRPSSRYLAAKSQTIQITKKNTIEICLLPDQFSSQNFLWGNFSHNIATAFLSLFAPLFKDISYKKADQDWTVDYSLQHDQSWARLLQWLGHVHQQKKLQILSRGNWCISQYFGSHWSYHSSAIYQIYLRGLTWLALPQLSTNPP